MIYNADLNEGFFNSFFYLNKYYGITKNPITNDFIIIMKYYELGSLKDYMTKNFYGIKWNEKLNILKHIAKGLDHIHNQKIIHRDFHSGNILYENEFDVVISDLGISKSSIKTTNDDDDNEIYGIISYMAPEILQRKEYTTASDIYSFGMIMWELMTGRNPFWDKIQDTELIIEICDGLRPPIVVNAPENYIELMQKCWHSDPNKRPTSVEILERFDNIIYLEENNPTEIIPSSNIGSITTNNSGTICKSRPLGTMISSAESTRSLKIQSINLEIGKNLF